MEDKILSSTKLLAGLTKDYEQYDPDIMMYINSVFLILKQLGIGPAQGFVLTDVNTVWEDFIPDDKFMREYVKTYMGAKVRLQFDPPQASTCMDALKQIINEFEWRLNVEAETPIY